MEVRDHCRQIVETGDIDVKLSAPRGRLSDRQPGPALRIDAPGRPPGLVIVRAAEAKVPNVEGMPDPAQRSRILHAFANHELQAVELFAWALLVFPDAPHEFRAGLLRILREEQMHCRLYIQRLKGFQVRFGDYPVSGYFWNKARRIRNPSQFVCAMSLTFENANLDHTIDYAEAARGAGDTETAALLERIHRDEIGHVRFGWEWLQRFKRSDQSSSEAYLDNIAWPLRPCLARGRRFHPEGREAAGLDPDFIHLLAESDGKGSAEEHRAPETRDRGH